MPLLLRKIRQARWYDHKAVPWLPEGSLQADALSDLKTEYNALSVWQVKDDKSNLEDIVTALAAECAGPTNLDYAIFDQALLLSIDVEVTRTPGQTSYAKASDWHRDLPELTAEKLMDLAGIIMTQAKRERLAERKIFSLVKGAVDRGEIPVTQLKPKWAMAISP
jgi:hypothetical protein